MFAYYSLLDSGGVQISEITLFYIVRFRILAIPSVVTFLNFILIDNVRYD